MEALTREEKEALHPAPVIKLFNDRLEDVQIGPALDRRVLGFINQRVQELKYMADYCPQDRRVHDEMIAGLALRRTPMVKEKLSYSVDQMRGLLSSCPELKEVELPPVDHKHEELEKFFKRFWPNGETLDFSLKNDILILFP